MVLLSVLISLAAAEVSNSADFKLKTGFIRSFALNSVLPTSFFCMGSSAISLPALAERCWAVFIKAVALVDKFTFILVTY